MQQNLILSFIPHSLLPYQHLAPTFPEIQLEHLKVSLRVVCVVLVVANGAWSR